MEALTLTAYRTGQRQRLRMKQMETATATERQSQRLKGVQMRGIFGILALAGREGS